MDGSRPVEMRDDKVPLLPPMILFTISAAFLVGCGGREGALDDLVDRRPGPVGAVALIFRRFPRAAPFVATEPSMSRSPSLSILVGPSERRLLIPPPLVDLPLVVLLRVVRWLRGPVGGAMVGSMSDLEVRWM